MNYELLALLQKSGLRNTTARQTVFSVLKKTGAVSTGSLITKTSPTLDRASVYRTLNLFRELGVVQDVVIAGRRKIELTDMFSPHHHHIACETCGKTIAIHDEAFEHQIERLARSHGFRHTAHSFEVTGHCANCQK